LQRSLQQWPGSPVTIEYKPFQLDPNIPPEGYDYKSYMKKKFGGHTPPDRYFDPPTKMGERVGLVFNFWDIPKAPNSLLAHCLIALTPAEKQTAVFEALYDAYFRDGRDIGQLETLIEIAVSQGLNGEEVRESLNDPTFQKKVEAEIQNAYQMGISGVPFFVINKKYAFSGAQPSETILDILRQVSEME
jgi:predicted DsbA family dithiol-disulfide isomerase